VEGKEYYAILIVPELLVYAAHPNYHVVRVEEQYSHHYYLIGNDALHAFLDFKCVEVETLPFVYDHIIALKHSKTYHFAIHRLFGKVFSVMYTLSLSVLYPLSYVLRAE